MANIDLDELKVSLRRFCGNPTGAPGSSVNEEVADSDIERAIRWAVSDINAKRVSQDIKISYFETVSNQQAYDVPTGVGKVVKIHWNQNYQDKIPIFSPDLPYPMVFNDALLGGVGDRCVGLINEIQNQEFFDQSSFSHKAVVKQNQFLLDPIPTQTGTKVYYEYLENVSDVEDLDVVLYEKAVYYGAAAVIVEQILTNRNNSAQVNESGFRNNMNISDLQILKNNFDRKFKEELIKIMG